MPLLAKGKIWKLQQSNVDIATVGIITIRNIRSSIKSPAERILHLQNSNKKNRNRNRRYKSKISDICKDIEVMSTEVAGMRMKLRISGGGRRPNIGYIAAR